MATSLLPDWTLDRKSRLHEPGLSDRRFSRETTRKHPRAQKSPLLCPMGWMCYKRRAEKPEMPDPDAVFGSSEQAAGTAARPNETSPSFGEDAAQAMNYCPRCSMRLASRSCKLICPGCGYYMSCSDFY
jgi:hypothetical protein